MRLERDGRLAAAVAEYQRAVEIWPGYAPLRVRLGRTPARDGRLAEAVRELRVAVAAGPDDRLAHLTLGVALATVGRWEDAVAHYRRALELAPDFAEARQRQNILATGLEHLPLDESAAPAPIIPLHPNLRGAAYYADPSEVAASPPDSGAPAPLDRPTVSEVGHGGADPAS